MVRHKGKDFEVAGLGSAVQAWATPDKVTKKTRQLLKRRKKSAGRAKEEDEGDVLPAIPWPTRHKKQAPETKACRNQVVQPKPACAVSSPQSPSPS